MTRDRIVVNNQHRTAADFDLSRRRLNRDLFFRFTSPWRQGYGEDRAPSKGAFGRDFAPHQLAEAPRQGEAKSSASEALLDGTVGLLERRKEAGQLLFRETYASI